MAKRPFGSLAEWPLRRTAGLIPVPFAVLKYNEHGCVWFRHPDGRVSSCFSAEVDPPLGRA
jgi:hypothetical protein